MILEFMAKLVLPAAILLLSPISPAQTTLKGSSSLKGSASLKHPHSVDLDWTASSSDGVTGYRVYRSTLTGGPYTLVQTVGVVTSATDRHVSGATTYYYVLTAIIDPGSGGTVAESEYSNEANAVIP